MNRRRKIGVVIWAVVLLSFASVLLVNFSGQGSPDRTHTSQTIPLSTTFRFGTNTNPSQP